MKSDTFEFNFVYGKFSMTYDISQFFFFKNCPNTGKYGPEKTPYLDTFHAV